MAWQVFNTFDTLSNIAAVYKKCKALNISNIKDHFTNILN